jgi:DNA-binding winged helix-turn-helix (wHTH) protein
VPVWVDAARGVAGRDYDVLDLSAQGVALLDAFAHAGDRVIGRQELRRRMGLVERDLRRCDSLLVQLRRALGPDAIVTVRGRGWRCLADVVPVGDDKPAGRS